MKINLAAFLAFCDSYQAMKTPTTATARKTSTVANIDREIALLIASRATASCNEELDMINESLDAAKAARRVHFRTGGTRSN